MNVSILQSILGGDIRDEVYPKWCGGDWRRSHPSIWCNTPYCCKWHAPAIPCLQDVNYDLFLITLSCIRSITSQSTTFYNLQSESTLWLLCAISLSFPLFLCASEVFSCREAVTAILHVCLLIARKQRCNKSWIIYIVESKSHGLCNHICVMIQWSMERYISNSMVGGTVYLKFKYSLNQMTIWLTNYEAACFYNATCSYHGNKCLYICWR